MTTTTELLPITEQAALDRCEAIIARGVQTFIDVGEALAEIRDARLYRTHYDTWEEYCTDRWGIGRARAYQLIAAAVVTREMSTVVDNPPTNEREARAIAKAAPATRPKVIARATELAGDQPRTAKHIEQAVEEVRESDLPLNYDVIKRRLAAHGVALLSNMQGHHRAFVTRKEGMTGVVTFTWADVLSKLERLEAEPPPKESDVAFRRTCPTCGETIINGNWGDLNECGSCYHARQRTPAPPAKNTAESDRHAHLAKEHDDQSLLSTAKANIAIGNIGDARRLLGQIQVSTWERDQLLRTLDVADARRFLADQRERLTRFSAAAMVSQATYTQALDHIQALLEVTE